MLKKYLLATIVFLSLNPVFAKGLTTVIIQPKGSVGGGGGGESPVGVDTFDRANATTITSSGEGGHTWSGGDSFSITSNKLDPETTAEYYPTYSVTMADADYCASLDVEGGTGRSTVGPSVRNSGGNKYHARVSNGTLELYKNTTSLGTTAVTQPTIAKTLKLCASGSGTTSLDIYYDGAVTPVLSYNDSSSPFTATGNPGVTCFYCDNASDVLGDNFKAFDTVGP